MEIESTGGLIDCPMAGIPAALSSNFKSWALLGHCKLKWDFQRLSRREKGKRNHCPAAAVDQRAGREPPIERQRGTDSAGQPDDSQWRNSWSISAEYRG